MLNVSCLTDNLPHHCYAISVSALPKNSSRTNYQCIVYLGVTLPKLNKAGFRDVKKKEIGLNRDNSRFCLWRNDPHPGKHSMEITARGYSVMA